ncbi:DUF1493 family protein [Pantoea sp. At-9b]|nr:DUF1493 family protein [Pantoea sp. At-9b]
MTIRILIESAQAGCWIY